MVKSLREILARRGDTRDSRVADGVLRISFTVFFSLYHNTRQLYGEDLGPATRAGVRLTNAARTKTNLDIEKFSVRAQVQKVMVLCPAL